MSNKNCFTNVTLCQNYSVRFVYGCGGMGGGVGVDCNDDPFLSLFTFTYVDRRIHDQLLFLLSF